MYSTTVQNRRGDVTIAWDEPDDPKILQMIERQMAQGFDFWLLEPRLGGLAAPQKVRLARAEDALRSRIVAMTLADGEEAIAGLIEAGIAQPIKPPQHPATRSRVKLAKKPAEVAAGESVRTRRKAGG